MKKTVLAMAKEDYDFSHRQGGLVFGVEKVEMEFVSSEVRDGSFSVASDNSLPVQGFVYTTESRMKCLKDTFTGSTTDIEYSFDSAGLEPGDIVTGKFIILSDKGEYEIPYEVTMEKDYMYSSMGPIKNLFHFTNLARSNWEEAVSLYYSNRFAELLTGNDKQYKCVYRGLSTEEGNEHCVDEFLITIHKKSRNTYETPTNHQVIRYVPTEISKSVTLMVNGWGYVRAEVSCPEEFIHLKKEVYTCEDMIDGQIEIEYTVDPAYMHVGRNFAFLTIETPEKTFRVQIVAEDNPIDMEHSANHIYKRTVGHLMRNYIAFRLGKITADDWIRISSEELSHLTVKGERAVLVKLFEIQLLLAANKKEDASERMARLEEELENPEAKLTGTTCAYYLYLTGMLNPDAEYVDKVYHKVKKISHKYSESPAIAWMMIYLKEDLTFRDDKRWAFLEEQYNAGISSPLLYAEAVHLLSKQPSLLVKLGGFERTLLDFALKNGAISAEIGERVEFLADREKGYDELLYDVLRAAYKIAPSKELLQGICQLLMRGNCTGEEYVRWYEDAIKADIRITRLYEFYMASIPADYKEILPKMVMMYFAYQNHLEYDKMALLYANVFEYKALVPEVAGSYEESIEGFLKEQIKKGHINKNLIKLYKKFVTPEFLDEEIASGFAPILFSHEVKVTRPGMKRAIIIHDKAVGEGKFPVQGDVAYTTIYSKDYCILFEDEKGNRYVSEAMSKPVPILYTKELRDTLLPMVEGRIGILLNAIENDVHDVEVNEENTGIYETLLTADSVTFTFKKEILYSLCKYYFENDRIRELDRLLLMVKPEVLPAKDRGEILHILVARGHYENAFKWLSTFGMEHVAEKTVMRLVSRYLERTDYAFDEHMPALSEEIYRKGRFDQVILRYLVNYFHGNTAEMIELLRHCESFGVDTFALVERILVQMLYVGVRTPERENLYIRYVKGGGSTKIRQAYLSENAYGAFVLEEKAPDSIYSEMEYLVKEGEELNRICRLAYAKNASGKGSAGWNIPLLKEIVEAELKKNVVFPFFLKFASCIPAVIPYTDRSFVEYKGNGVSRVILHYAIERENSDNTEYRKEEMDNLYDGIFVKDFILFAGDSVSYYITEETGNKEQLTLSATLTKNSDTKTDVPWRYEILNDAIEQREKGNEVESGEIIRDYAKLDFLTRRLFCPKE